MNASDTVEVTLHGPVPARRLCRCTSAPPRPCAAATSAASPAMSSCRSAARAAASITCGPGRAARQATNLPDAAERVHARDRRLPPRGADLERGLRRPAGLQGTRPARPRHRHRPGRPRRPRRRRRHRRQRPPACQSPPAPSARSHLLHDHGSDRRRAGRDAGSADFARVLAGYKARCISALLFIPIRLRTLPINPATLSAISTLAILTRPDDSGTRLVPVLSGAPGSARTACRAIAAGVRVKWYAGVSNSARCFLLCLLFLCVPVVPVLPVVPVVSNGVTPLFPDPLLWKFRGQQWQEGQISERPRPRLLHRLARPVGESSRL